MCAWTLKDIMQHSKLLSKINLLKHIWKTSAERWWEEKNTNCVRLNGSISRSKEAFAETTTNIHNNLIPTYWLNSQYVKGIVIVFVENAKLHILCPQDTYNIVAKMSTTNHTCKAFWEVVREKRKQCSIGVKRTEVQTCFY